MTEAPIFSYDHECAPPPRMPGSGRRRWFCPDCGTLWIYVRRIVGRRATEGAWQAANRVGEGEVDRLRRSLLAVHDAHAWQCDCTSADPCRIRIALEGQQ